MTKRGMLVVSLGPLLAVLVGGAGGTVTSGCTSSGNLTPLGDGSVLELDGGLGESDGQSASGFACTFNERATVVCPGVTLAPPTWQSLCVDGDNCASRQNDTATVDGCNVTSEYQNVTPLSESCAAWKASGGSIPAIDGGPAPVCAPSAPTSFAPAWHPPRAKATACTKTQIDSYRQCLDDSATSLDPNSCAEWTGTVGAADKACLACLESNESDAQYGALILLPTDSILNVAGCIALAEGKTDGKGCGGALSADSQCDRAACLPSCPTQTRDQLTTEAACEKAADKGVCASYEKPAECAGALESPDAGANAEEQECLGLPSGTADAVFEGVALVFCGGD